MVYFRLRWEGSHSWSSAVVSKMTRLQGLVGSNPTPSATEIITGSADSSLFVMSAPYAQIKTPFIVLNYAWLHRGSNSHRRMTPNEEGVPMFERQTTRNHLPELQRRLEAGWRVEEPLLQRSVLHRRGWTSICVRGCDCRNGERSVLIVDEPEIQHFAQRRFAIFWECESHDHRSLRNHDRCAVWPYCRSYGLNVRFTGTR